MSTIEPVCAFHPCIVADSCAELRSSGGEKTASAALPAGWSDEQIAEQRCFTAGRIIVHENKATRRPGKRADYLLRYTRDRMLAVVEAKPEDEPAATGMQQAKDYAGILKLKFAYATNGIHIIEFDSTSGTERELTACTASSPNGMPLVGDRARTISIAMAGIFPTRFTALRKPSSSVWTRNTRWK